MLGLKTSKKEGGRTAFTAKKQRGLQFWLAVNMHQLIKGKGLTLAQAAEEVSLRTESLPWMKRYSPEGLMDQYSRVWRKRFQRDLADILPFKPLP